MSEPRYYDEESKPTRAAFKLVGGYVDEESSIPLNPKGAQVVADLERERDELRAAIGVDPNQPHVEALQAIRDVRGSWGRALEEVSNRLSPHYAGKHIDECVKGALDERDDLRALLRELRDLVNADRSEGFEERFHSFEKRFRKALGGE